MSNAPDLTQDENQIITQSLALARSDKTRTTSQTNNVPLAAKHSGWIRVQDGDFNVRKFSKISKNNDESSGSVKATTIIHASAEEVNKLPTEQCRECWIQYEDLTSFLRKTKK